MNCDFHFTNMIITHKFMLQYFYIAIITIVGHSETKINNHLKQCLYNIGIQYFSPESVLVLSQTGQYCQNQGWARDDFANASSSCIIPYPQTDLLEPERTLLESELWQTIFVKSNNYNLLQHLSQKKHDIYILISYFKTVQGVVQDIKKQVESLTKYPQWNPRAKYIIITEHQIMTNEQLAEEIAAELWRFYIINAIFILQSPSSSNDTEKSLVFKSKKTVPLFDVYSWFPYHPVGRCGDIRDVVLIDQWVLNSETMESSLNNSSLFPNKVPKNLQGCPIGVSNFHYPPNVYKYEKSYDTNVHYEGTDVFLIEECVKRLNMSVVYLGEPPDNHYWGVHLENGTWTGVIGQVIRGKADIGAVANWYICHFVNEIECSTSHMIDAVKWFVPCAKPYPRWTSLSRVFTPKLWLLFLIVYAVVAVIMWLVVILSNKITTTAIENQAYTSLSKCVLNFWAVILEESASNNPPHVSSIRAVFLTWVLYCWAINTVYQVYLTTFMVSPGLQHQMSTEEDMLKSGIELGIIGDTASVFPELTAKRYHPRNLCVDLTVCIDRVAYNGDMSVILGDHAMDYLIASKYTNTINEPLICHLLQPFVIQIVTMIVKKGHPLLDHINNNILCVVQAGLIDQWKKNIIYKAHLSAAKDSNVLNSEYVKFSLAHLQSAFIFLIFGNLLSITVFILEILLKNRC